MSNSRKKIPSRETGTVPKVKYWKNATVLQDAHVSNNLASSLMPNEESGQLKIDTRNRQRCTNHQCCEDSCMDDFKIFPNLNSVQQINMSEGVAGFNANSAKHLRQPSGTIRKCDNITKYPDKMQIEEKLNQIREYVKVTNSLMSNIKEDQINREADTGELYQMLSALRDSERKLETLLVNREANGEIRMQNPSGSSNDESESNRPTLDTHEPVFQMFQNNVATQSNEIENKLEMSEKKLQVLHEHQNLLIQLQEKAENQMKDARKAQERLAAHANTLSYSVSPTFNGVNYQEQKQIIDKNRCPGSPDSRIDVNFQDQLQLINSTNDGREQMLRLLDASDNQLCSEQVALQQKLSEINSKKEQIDQLVSQMHNYIGDDGDDMGNQIRQIVAMKEQLATLKDMLAAVKSTEADLLRQNSIDPPTNEEPIINVKSGNITKAESVGRAESVSSRFEADRRWGSIGKQSNKSSISSSREQLQAELQAKKQELEELMYKDQDRTSAINRDVCNELMMDKGDHAFSLDTLSSSWTMLQDYSPPRESCVSRENVYSSDEDDLQNYSHSNNVDSVKTPDYDQRNFRKHTPNRTVINNNPIIQQDTPSTPSINQHWNGVDQKQVELMTNLCQSLLEQQRQLLPSQFSVPNFQWYTSYIQTQQTLMLGTISQCCQLLWLQQQDINALINAVTIMQPQQPKQSQSVKISHGPIDPVPSACSLPNLSTRVGSSNTQYAALTRAAVVSMPAQHTSSRNSAVPVISQQTQPIWTGAQALNNQVAPGNRANNYWDNFRSYSRQNLLSTSTKSNEGSQNSLPVLERNIGNVLTQSSSVPCSRTSTLSKKNSAIPEGGVSSEFNNYPQQQQQLKYAPRQNQVPKATKRNKGPCRNRNEWNKDSPQMENISQKSKLFDMLREKIYKEVTLLISANENRPHFLIQLFRDLQLISSDPLRSSALHSIQALVTHSLNENMDPGQQFPEENVTYSSGAQEQNRSETPLRCFPQQNEVGNMVEDCKIDSEIHHVLMELVPFLKSHKDETIHGDLIDVVKIMVFQLLPAKHSAVDNKLQSKLDALLTESLTKYQGRRVLDVREDLLKTVAAILTEVIQGTGEIKERPSIETHPKPPENILNGLMFLPNSANVLPFESLQFLNLANNRTDNGDLAEADQSRREAENEEGAVGGMMVCPNDNDQEIHTNNCDACF